MCRQRKSARLADEPTATLQMTTVADLSKVFDFRSGIRRRSAPHEWGVFRRKRAVPWAVTFSPPQLTVLLFYRDFVRTDCDTLSSGIKQTNKLIRVYTADAIDTSIIYRSNEINSHVERVLSEDILFFFVRKKNKESNDRQLLYVLGTWTNYTDIHVRAAVVSNCFAAAKLKTKKKFAVRFFFFVWKVNYFVACFFFLFYIFSSFLKMSM